MQEPSSFSSGYLSDGQFSYSARDGNLQDSAAGYPHQETAPTSLPVHQQEVPSSYSSVAGNELTDVFDFTRETCSKNRSLSLDNMLVDFISFYLLLIVE